MDNTSEVTTPISSTVRDESVMVPGDAMIEAMWQAGVHRGHIKSKVHPSMQPYIFGIRNAISVFNLEETKKCLGKAMKAIQDVACKGGIILFVGTRPGPRAIILDIATRFRMPYFVERWIGGALTNFNMIRERVQYLERLEQEKASGGFKKYNKKELARKEKEIERLKKNFDGLRTLTRLPDMIVVTNVREDYIAINEAFGCHIPIVAIADSDANISHIQYPIPSNDDAIPAVQWVVGKIGEAIETGIRDRSESAAQ